MRISSNHLTLLLKNMMIKRGNGLSTNHSSPQTATDQPSVETDQATFSPIVLGVHASADNVQPPSSLVTLQQISPEQATNALYDNGLLNQVDVHDATYSVPHKPDDANRSKSPSDEKEFRKQICTEFYSQARILNIASNDFDLSVFNQSAIPSILDAAKKATLNGGVYSQKCTTQRVVDYCLEYCSHNPNLYQSVLKILHLGFLDVEQLFEGTVPHLCYDTYKTSVQQFTTWAKTAQATASYL